MTFVVEDALIFAVAGLVVKEGVGVVKWVMGRKKPNGKGNGKVEALLADIKGQGIATLARVSNVQQSQAETEKQVAVIAAEMKGVNERCAMHMESMTGITDNLSRRVDQLDTRVFDLQKQK